MTSPLEGKGEPINVLKAIENNASVYLEQTQEEMQVLINQLVSKARIHTHYKVLDMFVNALIKEE